MKFFNQLFCNKKDYEQMRNKLKEHYSDFTKDSLLYAKTANEQIYNSVINFLNLSIGLVWGFSFAKLFSSSFMLGLSVFLLFFVAFLMVRINDYMIRKNIIDECLLEFEELEKEEYEE